MKAILTKWGLRKMKIGVSGASGNLGSAVVKYLVENRNAHAIVAISRTPDNVKTNGVEARFGDYTQPTSLVDAYRGLDKVLIIPSMDAGRRVEQNTAAIDAAVAAGVKHIVLMSSVGTRNIELTNMAGEHFAGEQHLMKNAQEWSVLRMSYYAESIIDEAKNALAYGVLAGLTENKARYVSRDNVAAAAAGILLGEGHNGAIYTATGPQALTGAERAEAVAQASGKPLNFITIPVEAMEEQLKQAQLPPFVINAIIGTQKNLTNGDFNIVTGDVEKLAGRKPKSFEEVVSTFTF